MAGENREGLKETNTNSTKMNMNDDVYVWKMRAK